MDYYIVKTLGCKANLADSQRIETEFQKRGWKPLPSRANQSDSDRLVCVVNSCTVTDEADRQSRKLASKLSRDFPRSRVIMTGCGAEVDPERMARSVGIDYVIGNQDKPALVEHILRRFGESQVAEDRAMDADPAEILGGVRSYSEMISRHPIDREWPSLVSDRSTEVALGDGFSRKTRAFLKIQEGCNAFCTYCVIPYGRGPSRSLRPREIIEDIRRLRDQGIMEVVLTGTNIGDYGTDWCGDPALAELVRLILAETDLPRLRLSSLDPTEISDELLVLMRDDSRLCPHFHVSLQSPLTRILRLMKRRYGSDEVKDCLIKIQAVSEGPSLAGRPIFVGMDVITGFPGETDEDFAETLALLESLPWARLHVFPFSEREGTPATRLPGAVPREKRLNRARVLNRLSLDRMKTWYASADRDGAGQFSDVLLEAPVLKVPAAGGPYGSTPYVAGYTTNYLRVVLPYSSEGASLGLSRNQLVSVETVSSQEKLWIDTASNEVALLAQHLAR